MTVPVPSRPVVLLTRRLPDPWIESLREQCDLRVGSAGPGIDAALREGLPQAHGILSLLTEPIDAELLDAAPNLRVVSNMAVGVDNVDLKACTKRFIPVGHTPGVLTEATADLTMTLMLAAARRLPQATADAKEGRWTTWTPDGWLGRDLWCATLGIVGLGQIGTAVARRARAFGMQIVYTNRSPLLDAAAQLGARSLPFDALLEVADIVSIHAPLTPATRLLFDDDAFDLMKDDAILVNTARGPIVDTDALTRALSHGQIGAAALDVVDPEPLPAEHPLYAMPNAIVAPHIGSATAGTRQQMAQLAIENLLAGLEGRRLPHCANQRDLDRHTTRLPGA